MADLKKSIKDEMNSTPRCIPAKWDRFTVADGDWMQAKTLDQLMNRDDFLADKIGEGNSGWKDDLSSESATRYSYDQYLSASISSLSGEFYTFSADDYLPTVTSLSSLLNYEISRATQVENNLSGRISIEETARSAADAKLQEQIDVLQAATDVIAVFGTYDEFVAGSGDLGVTDNDTIKVLRDYNYRPPSADEDYDEDQQYDDDGFQVYYEWHDPNAEPQHTDWTGWSAIGSLDPYYSVAEIDDYLDQINDEFVSLSATVAYNYLSANTDAVKPGHNINVTEKTGPVIEISTKDNVDFVSVSSTKLSADTAWVDTISADVSAFDFYETTSGKRLSETQQGLFINTTDSPFDPTKSASEGDVFWPSKFEEIFSAWYDTDKLINIKYTNTFNENTRLYTLHNVKQYTDNEAIFYDLNFISNDDRVAYTAYAKVKRFGGEGGGAPICAVLYACDEGPIDVEYTGEHGVYVSGDHKVGLSSTYETALKEGSAASAYITSHSGDFLNSAQNAYNKLTFKFGNTTKDYQANSSAYSFIFSAGSGVDFITGTNQITISSEGTTYTQGTYISTANKQISVTGTLLNSAQSGQSAYNWITTKSATLSAGKGIIFSSAATNTLGITVDYTTDNGYVTKLDGIPLSAGANYSQGRCITIDAQNKINLSSDVNLNSNLVIDHYNDADQETYASANLASYKLDFSGSRENGGSFKSQSATYGIQQLKIHNYADTASLHFAELDYDKLQLSAFNKHGNYNVTTYTNLTNEFYETQWAGSPSNYFLKFDGHSISAGSDSNNVSTTSWLAIINNAKGTWVSGTKQEITIDAPYQTKFVVTSTIPGTLNANTYYII